MKEWIEMAFYMAVLVAGLICTVSAIRSAKSAKSGAEEGVDASMRVLDTVLADCKERMVREEEILALNRKQLAQGDETIALLKSLNENLENRTLKN